MNWFINLCLLIITLSLWSIANSLHDIADRCRPKVKSIVMDEDFIKRIFGNHDKK